jgi:hypothetical protein
MAEAALKLEPQAPLSPAHEMLAQVERQTHPHFINRVANHVSVDRFVRGYVRGRLDFTEAVANPANYILAGEHGAMLFHAHHPGIYECHTMTLPDGRGKWTLKFVRACLFWMFTRTDAIEICTKIPQGNVAARTLVKLVGGVYEFTVRDGWVMKLDPVPADIFSMHIQQWIRDADGLPERGVWFRQRLEQEFARFGVEAKTRKDDAAHDRQTGAACEMIFGGQPQKGVVFYNRLAVMAGYLPITINTIDPLTIDTRDAVILVRDGDFRVISILT